MIFKSLAGSLELAGDANRGQADGLLTRPLARPKPGPGSKLLLNRLPDPLQRDPRMPVSNPGPHKGRGSCLHDMKQINAD